MKHLVNLDEAVLARAKHRLGTDTIKATVNAALQLAAADDHGSLTDALEVLGSTEFIDREQAWR